MSKKYNFINKILCNDKVIESRWYMTRRDPWKTVKEGDLIYFKNSGENITAVAKVSSIEKYEDLNPVKVHAIFMKHSKDIGFEKETIEDFYERIQFKKYCILIWLTDAKKVAPFDISKKGFGNSTAWISIENLNQIKK